MSEHAADAQSGGGAVAGDGAAPGQALQLIVTQTCKCIGNDPYIGSKERKGIFSKCSKIQLELDEDES